MDFFLILISSALTLLNIGILIFKPLFQTFVEWKNRGRKIQNDYQSIKDLEEMSREDKVFILLILNHIIDGNNIEKLKETRKELIKKIPQQIGGEKDD